MSKLEIAAPLYVLSILPENINSILNFKILLIEDFLWLFVLISLKMNDFQRIQFPIIFKWINDTSFLNFSSELDPWTSRISMNEEMVNKRNKGMSRNIVKTIFFPSTKYKLFCWLSRWQRYPSRTFFSCAWHTQTSRCVHSTWHSFRRQGLKRVH